MNRRITDPHQMPPWTDENAGFPEPEVETDPRLRAAVVLVYLVTVLAVIGLACLWRYAA